MPQGPKNLRIAFSGHTLTHLGGLYLLARFFRKIRLRFLLTHAVQFPQRNNRYSIAEMLLALMYPLMLGVGRLEATHLLRSNGVFQYLTGLPAYPNPTMLRRFLFRMGPLALLKLRKLHDRLLCQMVQQSTSTTRFLFDLDSTVLILYGKQEHARIGYNPIKEGRPSYHPLLCFEGHTQDCWHGELRAGDAHTASGTPTLLEACFAKLPVTARTVVIRADKGFYDHHTFEWLEAHRASFVIVARLTPPLKRQLPSLHYTHAGAGVHTAQFSYHPHGWEKSHRFVVIRRPKPEDSSVQLTIFPIGRYVYQVLVTNLSLQPINLWRFYNDRAAMEFIIKELKGDYSLAKIPTQRFLANATYFHLLLFSYNLINWFKRLCLPDEFQKVTLRTLRTQLILIPGELVRVGNRPILKLPTNFLH